MPPCPPPHTHTHTHTHTHLVPLPCSPCPSWESYKNASSVTLETKAKPVQTTAKAKKTPKTKKKDSSNNAGLGVCHETPSCTGVCYTSTLLEACSTGAVCTCDGAYGSNLCDDFASECATNDIQPASGGGASSGKGSNSELTVIVLVFAIPLLLGCCLGIVKYVRNRPSGPVATLPPAIPMAPQNLTGRTYANFYVANDRMV